MAADGRVRSPCVSARPMGMATSKGISPSRDASPRQAEVRLCGEEQHDLEPESKTELAITNVPLRLDVLALYAVIYETSLLEETRRDLETPPARAGIQRANVANRPPGGPWGLQWDHHRKLEMKASVTLALHSRNRAPSSSVAQEARRPAPAFPARSLRGTAAPQPGPSSPEPCSGDTHRSAAGSPCLCAVNPARRGLAGGCAPSGPRRGQLPVTLQDRACCRRWLRWSLSRAQARVEQASAGEPGFPLLRPRADLCRVAGRLRTCSVTNIEHDLSCGWTMQWLDPSMLLCAHQECLLRRGNGILCLASF
ncbi:uncharacterized protein LOC132028156 [Mustela nigripes]|uniref:uncharacterized protein LOC132028156 n=1 Tax=Mustela nigripes TaxID=77151 RepID=UPI002814CE1F|nr:uncharacterized protein LOC132028156 [Mustela nigripes]